MQQVETRRSELRELNDLSFARIGARFGEAHAEMDRRFAELIRWSFVFWVGSTVTLVVALAAVARFAR